MAQKKTALIVGGTSGLGLELAKRLLGEYEVHSTGRTDPKVSGITFHLAQFSTEVRINVACLRLISGIPPVDLLIYAAGFYQEGTIADLSNQQITDMIAVGLVAPAFLLRTILSGQGRLDGFIAITSTSQWTPRLKEPVYTAVKAGLAMLANSVSLDERVGKVLVAAPSGMRTKFWEKDGRDTSEMLDPAWVAERIVTQYHAPYKYKFIKILREPARVEYAEVRP